MLTYSYYALFLLHSYYSNYFAGKIDVSLYLLPKSLAFTRVKNVVPCFLNYFLEHLWILQSFEIFNFLRYLSFQCAITAANILSQVVVCFNKYKFSPSEDFSYMAIFY